MSLPEYYSPNGSPVSEEQPGPLPHKLRAPVNSLLSLSDLKNHVKLNTSEDFKLEELLETMYAQAEKLSEIITNLKSLINIKDDDNAENVVNEKLSMNHIVLVDDDPLIIMVHKMILAKLKKETLIVDFSNPLNALDYISINNPDMVFLDINMPEMNAWEFLNRLEKDLKFTTPVIIISSSVDPDEKVRAYSHKSVKDFISKPLTYEKLHSLFY